MYLLMIQQVMSNLEIDHVSRSLVCFVRTSVSIKFKLVNEHRYLGEVMKIHVNFTCRQWVSVDDSSAPLNLIWVHANANHRPAH
jgi:hypothetical protein